MGDNVGEYSVPTVPTTNSQKISSQASVEIKPSRKLGYKIGGILVFLIFLGLFIWLSYLLGFGEGEGHSFFEIFRVLTNVFLEMPVFFFALFPIVQSILFIDFGFFGKRSDKFTDIALTAALTLFGLLILFVLYVIFSPFLQEKSITEEFFFAIIWTFVVLYCLSFFFFMGIHLYRRLKKNSSNESSVPFSRKKLLLRIGIPIVLIAILILVPFVSFNLGKMNEGRQERLDKYLAVNATELGECSDASTQSVMHDCYSVVAASKGDATICEKIEGRWVYDRNECYRLVARKNKDPSLCRDDLCYRLVARDLKDYNICENIGPGWEYDDCISGVANAKDDYLKCYSFNDSYDRSQCLGNIARNTLNVSLCFDTSNYWENGTDHYCFKNVATRLNDSTICEFIDDEYNMGACYVDVAYSSNDLSLCDKANTERIPWCKFILTYDPIYCPQLEENLINLCWESAAAHNNDDSYCDKVVYEDSKYSTSAERVAQCKKNVKDYAEKYS